jgi:hypothetical protein
MASLDLPSIALAKPSPLALSPTARQYQTDRYMDRLDRSLYEQYWADLCME